MYSPLFIVMVTTEGFEPPAYGLEGRCSIQLSYVASVLILPQIKIISITKTMFKKNLIKVFGNNHR